MHREIAASRFCTNASEPALRYKKPFCFPFLIHPPGSFTFVPLSPLTRTRQRGCPGKNLLSLGGQDLETLAERWSPALHWPFFSAAASPKRTGQPPPISVTTRLRKNTALLTGLRPGLHPGSPLLYSCPVSQMVLSQINLRNFSRRLERPRERSQ